MKLKILLLSFLLLPIMASAVSFTPNVPIPSPDNNPAFTGFTNNGTIAPIGQLVKDVIKYLIGIAGILGTIMLMYGGFLYTMSGGQGKLITDAQNHITSALIGIVLAATSYIILATVNTDLVNFKATSISTIKAMGCCEQPKNSNGCGYTTADECVGGFIENTNAGSYLCYENKCAPSAAVNKVLGITETSGGLGEPCGNPDLSGYFFGKCIKGSSCGTLAGVGGGRDCKGFGGSCCAVPLPVSTAPDGTCGNFGEGKCFNITPTLKECPSYLPNRITDTNTTNPCQLDVEQGGSTNNFKICCGKNSLINRQLNQSCEKGNGTCQKPKADGTCPSTDMYPLGHAALDGATCEQDLICCGSRPNL